ncbi:MAG: hypothetical protein O2871_02675 [bacterium]|nr:hypothetical protein [bacterium]
MKINKKSQDGAKTFTHPIVFDIISANELGKFAYHSNPKETFVMFPWGETPSREIASAMFEGPIILSETFHWPIKITINSGTYTIYGYNVQGKDWNPEIDPIVSVAAPFYLTEVVDSSCNLPITKVTFKDQPNECKLAFYVVFEIWGDSIDEVDNAPENKGKYLIYEIIGSSIVLLLPWPKPEPE